MPEAVRSALERPRTAAFQRDDRELPRRDAASQESARQCGLLGWRRQEEVEE